jgi:hypothetical protein
MNNEHITEPLSGGSSCTSISPNLIGLEEARIANAKRAFSTRRIPLNDVSTLLTGNVVPESGDLLLARVTRLRQHKRLELPSGRRAHMHVGDEILVCYGHRYAPDQFEALIPVDLSACHLVAAGGIASRYVGKHDRVKPPTEIEPVGIVCDARGDRVNLNRFKLTAPDVTSKRPFTVAVVGTAMNAGKTTMAGSITAGLTRGGLRVGVAKVTGTGSGGDLWFQLDAGAQMAIDFTDVGYSSTFGLTIETLEEILVDLTAYLSSQALDVILLELADGIYQKETAALLESGTFSDSVDALMFAAPDACGAAAGVAHLEQLGHKVMGVGGALTASPMAAREAQQALPVPVYSLADLSSPEVVNWLIRCSCAENETRIA